MPVKVATAGYCSLRLSLLCFRLLRTSNAGREPCYLHSLKSYFPLSWAYLQFTKFLIESDIKSHKGALNSGMIHLRFWINSSELLFVDLIWQELLSFIYIYKFIYLFLAVLGVRCCTRAFSSCDERGLLFVVVRRLLIAVASLVAEHRL